MPDPDGGGVLEVRALNELERPIIVRSGERLKLQLFLSLALQKM